MTQRILLHMTAPLREDFDISYHDIGEGFGPPAEAAAGPGHAQPGLRALLDQLPLKFR